MARKNRTWKMVEKTDRLTHYQAQEEPETFSVRLRHGPRKYQSLTFVAPSVETAVREAPFVAGLETRAVQEGTGITLDEAFADALNHTRRRERSRQDWHNSVVRFAKWLEKSHPACAYWTQLTRQIVREYHDSLRGRADNTIRLAFQCLRQTSRYMAREYDLKDVAQGLGTATRLVRPPARVSLVDVLDFVDWVESNAPTVLGGVALQGLAGLQLQEATRLTWDHIDLRKGLVEISGEVKNDYRQRVIPVCDRVVQALRIAEKSKVRSMDGRIFPYHWMNYSKMVSQALKTFNAGLGWQPKDLRNCLLQFAIQKGIKNDVWEQYVGHSPNTVTGAHYMYRISTVSRGEEELLDEQMSLFRCQVTEVLNDTIEANRHRRKTKACRMASVAV